MREIQANTPVRRVIVTDVTDYVRPPLKALVDRSLRKDGLLAEVPEAEGVYRFRPLLNAHPEPPPAVEVLPDDIALFQYTGGTTGVPKAAMLAHHNLVANMVQIRAWMPSLVEGHERCIGALPFFHVYGMTVAMLLTVYHGSELIILPNPRHIETVMQIIHREKASLYPGVPAMYIGIINHPDVKKYDLRSVKACLSGAAPLPMEVQIKFGELTGGRLIEGYGLTEAAPVTHANPIFGERRAGSIGLPWPDVDARIVDPDTLQDLGDDQAGELWVRGPQVMRGYWNKTAETQNVITADGWLRTGDIARRDKDGYFYIVDRLKDIIIVSGFNVVPREVEEVLFEHPKVQEAVVAGIPDSYRGESVKAYVVLKAGQIGDGGGDHRLLQRAPGALQGPETDRVPLRAAEDHGRQVLAPRAGRRGKAEAGRCPVICPERRTRAGRPGGQRPIAGSGSGQRITPGLRGLRKATPG